MKYTDYEIEQMEALCRELLSANEELNARCIAFSAKLENEEKKVVNLSQRLAQLSLMFTNQTYKG